MNFLTDLNEEQKKAVLKKEGPVLILAGAGAGKTKTLTYRIADIIKSGTDPEKILAVTFTNKASSEMKDRIKLLLQTEKIPTVRTFHGLGVLILKENHKLLELPKNFSILDRSDSKKIVKDILKEQSIDDKQYDPAKIISIISKQKGNMVSPDDFLKKILNYKDDYHILNKILPTVWSLYEKKLKEMGSLDFDDLLIWPVRLLNKNKEVREFYQNRWKYIHVDEYQDTNEVQYQLTKILADKHKNICVVGDVDQNIYSWRGATIKNIMDFEKDYPNSAEIILEKNYRSTKNILKAANEIISKNSNRREKNLYTDNSEGEKITIYRAIDEYEEARYIVDKCLDLIEKGVSPSEIGILYRANFQSRVLEEICLEKNIPHQIVGTRFFDRKEIKDVIAYIKLAINHKDLTSLSRIINVPARGIGKTTLTKIISGKESEINQGTLKKIEVFRKLIKEIKEKIESSKPSEIITFIIKKTGLEDNFLLDGDDGLERLQNVRELVSLSKKYDFDFIDESSKEVNKYEDAINNFIEDISLYTDQDSLEKNREGIKLMTVHAAKGLEFNNVFVTGLESGLFPMEKQNEKTEDKEEERRLFYVAITRACKKLFLTWASFRTIFGSKQVSLPSEFIDDISDGLIDYESFGDSQDDFKNKYGNNGDNPVEYLIDF